MEPRMSHVTHLEASIDGTRLAARTVQTVHEGRPLLVRYDLDDPALRDIGRIIHEADIGDDLYDAPEAPGLDRLIRGVSLTALDDHQLLAITQPLYDGLYELLRRSHLHEDRPA